MTVTAPMADAGSGKLYDMVTAVLPQTVSRDEVPATAVVIAGGDKPLPADRFWDPTVPTHVCPAEDMVTLTAQRLACFPVWLLQAAFRIKVEEGEATEPPDRRHILNYLTGNPPDSEPPRTHEKYDRINKLLHTHYALGGLPRCYEEAWGDDVDDMGEEALLQCLAALRASPPPDRFVVSAPFNDATVKQLIDLLPPTLQHLQLSDASMTKVPESVGKFTALRTLKLIRCEWLTALPESVGDLGALRALDLTECETLATMPESVGNLGALQKLNLCGCSNLTALPESVGNLGALLTLGLCSTNLAALPESVGNLGALHTLGLSYCTKLTALPESVGNLVALQTLNLIGCKELKTLPASITQLTQLDEASRKRVEAILSAHQDNTTVPSWLRRWSVPGLVIFVAMAVALGFVRKR
jgi:hypothetical protein